ncbi:BTAD domain-containing putative transcriptional regulator [Streptacidiphilus sp. N1-12]|uniref:BTAD domain-containing putative transcriptional regulator n=2 Tax=Streptacidiphilus alkalitolerans TaxID=3342712 RepID=A0ABV6WTZ7_9ACTN
MVIELSLLGGWRLAADGRPAALPEAARKVVAYVAVRGPSTRQQLIGALWPESPEAQAGACLRSTLWRIRRCLEDLLVARGEWVSLDPRVRLDLAGLRSDLLRVPDPPRPGPEELDGELLPDWYDDWLLVEQERLRQQCLHALERLAAVLADEGDYGAALQTALDAVRIDPLRESAHRAVIGIHLSEGNRSEALRHYAAYRRLLHDELGLEPSPLLRCLVPPSPADLLTGPGAARTALS